MAKVMSRKDEGRAAFRIVLRGPLLLFTIDDYAKRLKPIVLIFY